MNQRPRFTRITTSSPSRMTFLSSQALDLAETFPSRPSSRRKSAILDSGKQRGAVMPSQRKRSFERLERPKPYTAPLNVQRIWLRDLLQRASRPALTSRQLEFFHQDKSQADIELYYAGDLNIALRPIVSIVGTREATFEGISRATRIARELAQAGVVVMSGLARGIDGAAHRAAIKNGAKTVAVIGTPLSKASPSENATLQEEIWRENLLISPFREGDAVFRSNFPQRNRVMAVISDATVIVEASDTSGTLHQAAECQLVGRWLFILRSVVDSGVVWPSRFLGGPKTEVLDKTEDLLTKIMRQ
jgi:DNA processing protein